MQDYYPLTKENIMDLIGKKVEFTAEAYEGNSTYRGIAIISAVDYSKKNPISCECISGDDLKFAFLDDHGLTTDNNGLTYQLTKECTSFSYSDSYREIFVREL